jgi:hypothetical protein
MEKPNMSTLLVSYDLASPERIQDYNKIHEYIKGSYSSWAKPLYSQYLIRTTKTPTEVRVDLIQLVDGNDKLLVLDVSNDDWAYYNMPSEVASWINKTL